MCVATRSFKSRSLLPRPRIADRMLSLVSVLAWIRIDGGACPFLQCVNGVNRTIVEALHHPARPAHLDKFYFRNRPQAEMYPEIALGNVARTAAHFIDHLACAGLDYDFCADSVPVGARTHSFERDPMIARPYVVHQQTRCCVHVADHDGEIPVIAE